MALHDPFDSQKSLPRCSCGNHGSQAEHDVALAQDDVDALNSRVVQSAVMRALFPQDAERRRFLRAVGWITAWPAISRWCLSARWRRWRRKRHRWRRRT